LHDGESPCEPRFPFGRDTHTGQTRGLRPIPPSVQANFWQLRNCALVFILQGLRAACISWRCPPLRTACLDHPPGGVLPLADPKPVFSVAFSLLRRTRPGTFFLSPPSPPFFFLFLGCPQMWPPAALSGRHERPFSFLFLAFLIS